MGVMIFLMDVDDFSHDLYAWVSE